MQIDKRFQGLDCVFSESFAAVSRHLYEFHINFSLAYSKKPLISLLCLLMRHNAILSKDVNYNGFKNRCDIISTD